MATKRKGRYYKYGYGEGANAAHDTNWQPGEMLEKWEADELGEVAGEILENWQQMAGTIYYSDATNTQLNAFEEGFYDGFADEVGKMVKQKENPKPSSKSARYSINLVFSTYPAHKDEPPFAVDLFDRKEHRTVKRVLLHNIDNLASYKITYPQLLYIDEIKRKYGVR